MLSIILLFLTHFLDISVFLGRYNQDLIIILSNYVQYTKTLISIWEKNGSKAITLISSYA